MYKSKSNYVFLADGSKSLPFKYAYFEKTTNENGVVLINSLGSGITKDNIVNVIADNDLRLIGYSNSGWLRFYYYSNGSWYLYANSSVTFKVIYL